MPDVQPSTAAVPTTFGAWSAWHDDLTTVKHRSPETVRAYRFTFFDFAAFIAPKRWDRATPADLDRYLARRARTANGQRRVLAAATQRAYAKPIRGFYAYAHAAGLVRRNPMATYRLPPEPIPVGRGLDPDELRRLFVVLEDDARVYTMCWLGFGQLLRAGEIARARVEEVILARGEERMLVHGKGGRDEWMSLNPDVAAVLRCWLAGRRQGPLFESLVVPGAPIAPDRVYRLLGGAVKQVKAEGSGHWLRHSGAHTLRRNGVPIDTLARTLRHANMNVTRRYYLAGFEEDVRGALGAMGDPRRPR